ncbi:lengsin isoform X2 [Narcine bancroftii]|uniref:lengsin isoform X2 n=1 Tax=Narcine bancroftii TaxID=1343680 RepID=UPI0038313B40
MNSSNPSEVDFMIEQVKQQITREDIRFIRFEASDLNGISRSKTIPARFFQEKVLHGIPMPRGYLEVIPSPHENEADHSGADEDILFMPDISTFRVLPWAAKTARVICDPCTVTGSPLLTSPRQVARLQLDHLRGLGFALRSSFTYEFCLYGFAQAPNTNATLPAATLLDNHDQSFVHELIEGMDGAGVVVDSFSSSRRPGQMEVTLRPEFGMGAADNAFAFRTGLKELARKREHAAGFSAPCSGPGNRGALTHSLWDARGTRNLFSDGQAAQGLSNAGRRWRAGLLQHAAALSGLALPGVGIPRAPGLGCSGSRALHAKLHAGGGARLENRLASAVANPYLVLAATVAAGLDGLRGAAAADGATTSTVPVRPEDALRELERDHCIQRALGESFAQYFIAVKRLELKTQAPDGEAS